MPKTQRELDEVEDAQIEARNRANAGETIAHPLPPLPQPIPTPVAETGDAPVPTVENEPGKMFVPGSGISSLDIFEISLMYLIELTNSQVQFEKGTLRKVVLSAQRAEQLSDSALRFMKPAHTGA